MLSEPELKILENLALNGGYLPDRPVLKNPASAVLMRKGLIEAIDPPQTPGRSKPIPYIMITPAGRQALEASDG